MEKTNQGKSCRSARKTQAPSEGTSNEFDWEAWVLRRDGRLRGIVGGLIRVHRGPATADRVDEVFQEALLRMLSSKPFLRRAAGRSLGEVEAYFRRVVRAVLVDDLRRYAALKRGGCLIAEGGELDDLIEDPAEGPEERLLLAEARRHLSRRLQESLPRSCSRRDRELLDRVVFEGERVCDVVRQSREPWTVGAAYIALHRMRRAARSKGRATLLN